MPTPQGIPIEPEEDEDDEPGRGRSRDPELLAIERMLRMLDKLEPEARPDVVEYMTRRFNRKKDTQS